MVNKYYGQMDDQRMIDKGREHMQILWELERKERERGREGGGERERDQTQW